MQIKTTVRYPLILNRLANIKSYKEIMQQWDMEQWKLEKKHGNYFVQSNIYIISETLPLEKLLHKYHSCGGGGDLVTKLCLTLVTPQTVACQTLLSIGFCRQEYWSGLPFPSPGDLPDPGLELDSPALQADSLQTELWREALKYLKWFSSFHGTEIKVHSSWSIPSSPSASLPHPNPCIALAKKLIQVFP